MCGSGEKKRLAREESLTSLRQRGRALMMSCRGKEEEGEGEEEGEEEPRTWNTVSVLEVH